MNEEPTPPEISQTMRGPSPIFGFILSFLIPPIGLTLSIWALIAAKKNHQKGRVIASIGTFVGLVLTTGIVALFWFLFLLSGGGHPNKAQEAMKPIEAQLVQHDGQKLCVNGDNGHTLDNNQPWYMVYYAFSDAKELTKQIEDASAQSGYTLQADSARITDLQAGYERSAHSTETYSSSNDYLIGTNQSTNSKLNVEIIRSGQIPLGCHTGTYGEAKSPAPNGAIVMLSASFTSNQ